MLVPAALALLAACSDSIAPSSLSSAVPADSTLGSYVRWSDASAWPGGKVPKAGEDVVIPAGTHMVLDASPAPMRTLTIRGELSMGDADLALSAGRIDVFGTLRAGSADHPYRRNLTITLTDATSDDLRKGILVQADGDIELFGAPRVMWTRLTATAPAGATTIAVDSTTSWRAGDRIVVAPTDVDQDHAEVMELARDADGNSLTLTQPLRFQHWGVKQQIAGATLDERAEVGLLSHNIVIQGDANSEATGIGAHVMVMWHGTAHVDGVEFYRVGQRGVLARYPFHWHLAGDVPGQFVKRSSVWHSYSRCMTIHGTNDALLEYNVCYDHVGHGYFIEDGIEHGNTLRGNMALVSHPGTLIPTDVTPANFWITNPDNTFENNVAAGSVAFGFWIAPVYHPTGPSYTADVWPSFTPLRRFAGNVAHSIGGQAFHVEGPADAYGMAYTDYRPRANARPDGAPVIAEFSGLTAYRANLGFWARGDHFRVTGSVFADNGTSVQIGDAGLASASFLDNSTLIGASAAGEPVPGAVGFRIYDGDVHLNEVTFANYGPGMGDGAAIRPLPGFGGRISALNDVRALHFVNAQRMLMTEKIATYGESLTLLQDPDGSITGFQGGSLVARTSIGVDTSCVERAEWFAYACRSPHASIAVTNGSGLAPVTIRRDDGAQARGPYYATANVPTAHTYEFTPDQATSARFSMETEALGAGDWIAASMPWPRAAGGAFPYTDGLTIVTVPTREALYASASTAAWFDTANQRVYVRFVGDAKFPHQWVMLVPAGVTP